MFLLHKHQVPLRCYTSLPTLGRMSSRGLLSLSWSTDSIILRNLSSSPIWLCIAVTGHDEKDSTASSNSKVEGQQWLLVWEAVRSSRSSLDCNLHSLRAHTWSSFRTAVIQPPKARCGSQASGRLLEHRRSKTSPASNCLGQGYRGVTTEDAGQTASR